MGLRQDLGVPCLLGLPPLPSYRKSQQRLTWVSPSEAPPPLEWVPPSSTHPCLPCDISPERNAVVTDAAFRARLRWMLGMSCRLPHC